MRFLHLCDLHIGIHSDAQLDAMTQLVNAIDKAAADQELDLVFLTGDLAFSGIQEEYAALKTTLIDPLRSLKVMERTEFVAVPGNHDLDCNCSHPLAWSVLGKERQKHFWDVDKGKEIRSNRASGFKAYTDFLKSEKISGPDPTGNPGSRLEVETKNGNSLSIICINTALFSDKQFSREEEIGKAPMPVQTVRTLAKNKNPHGLIIVMGHHPVTWFEQQSKQHFLSMLKDMGAVYLHGHEHEIVADFGIHSIRTLGFGAAYPASLEDNSKPPYTSTFAIGEVRDELHLKFVAWEPTHGSWRPYHTLPADFEKESSILQGGYEIPVPISPAVSSVPRLSPVSRAVRVLPKFQPPIWIQGDITKGWTSLLSLLEVISEPYKVSNFPQSNAGIYSRFLISDGTGTHLIQASSAETTIVTPDHVERVNTAIDTLQLDSCIIATLGKMSEGATNLVNSLRKKKRIEVFDGKLIAEKLSELERVTKNLVPTEKENTDTIMTPLVSRWGNSHTRG